MVWSKLIHEGVNIKGKYIQQNTLAFFKLNKIHEEYLYYWYKLPSELRKNQKIHYNFKTSLEKFSKVKVPPDLLHNKKLQRVFTNFKTPPFRKSLVVSNMVHVDGNQMKLNNNVEPPGIFIGRGNHALCGCIKQPVNIDDITLNCSKECVKNLQRVGFTRFVHEKPHYYIAYWTDHLFNKRKYIYFLNNQDDEKFKIAQKLGKHLHVIRQKYNSDVLSTNLKQKSIAVIVYLLDKLYIRIGHEKECYNDSIGCSNLRVCNFEFRNNYYVNVRFHGKDSIFYNKVFKLSDTFYKVLKSLCRGKKKSDEVFHASATDVNVYLSQIMPNLSAKVFRTYHASKNIYNMLKNARNKSDLSVALNKVAVQLNHVKMKNNVYVPEKQTCLQNYIDPRIIYSFVHKNSLNISDVYSAQLIDKFIWASSTTANFVY